MAFSVTLNLDTRTKNKDNTHTIVLQVIVNRKVTTIATNYAVPLKDWDDKKKEIKKGSTIATNITRINNILVKERGNAIDILTKLYDDKLLDRLSLKEIRAKITSKATHTFVLSYFKSVIDALQKTGNIGNARTYTSAYNSIKTFAEGIDFPFSQITYAWLKKYEEYYLSKDGNGVNGLSVYIRTLRALYNRAILENIAKLDEYPFKHYKIKKQGTQKRALKEEHIESIRNLDTTNKSKRLNLAKDLFLTSFYLIGISFIDLAHLKLFDIHDGRISYRRKKTKGLLTIKINPKLQAILDKYLSNKKPTDYIFPIIRRSDPLLAYRDVKNQIKIYNKMLKEIAELCEINEDITSYWSRHSWATIAKRKGVKTAVISESLGHTSEETTQIYLDSFENEVIDEANALVINQ